MRITETHIQKFNTWAILLFMPLSTYITPITNVTYGDILLGFNLILLCLSIVKFKINLRRVVPLPFLLYISLIIAHSSVFYMVEMPDFYLTLGLFRYLLHMSVVLLGVRYFISIDYFIKIYIKVAVVVTLYIYAQRIALDFFSVILPTNVFYLPTTDTIESLLLFTDQFISGDRMYRPRSTFMEPAVYAEYVIPILYYLLNLSSEHKRKNYYVAIFLSGGILVSGSGTGIVLLFVSWLKTVYLLLEKFSKYTVLMYLAVISFVIAILQSPFLMHTVITRIFGDGSTKLSTPFTNRASGIVPFFDGTYSIENIFFGHGMWNDTAIYSSGFIPVMFKFGIFFTAIFISILLLSYKNSGHVGKHMIILTLILGIATNVFFEIHSVNMFAFIYIDYQTKKNQESIRLSQKIKI